MTPMRYGISAGSLIVQDNQLLLVHHLQEGEFNFWVPPGGSLVGDESIFECAQRETFEETGLQVDLGPIVYIQEFVEPGYHFCKFFILCTTFQGQISLAHRDFNEGFLVDARFFSQEKMSGLTVFPEILKEGFWNELKAGFLHTHYLGLEMIRGEQ
jgi:8-oxo-dGTP diphosphatase